MVSVTFFLAALGIASSVTAAPSLNTRQSDDCYSSDDCRAGFICAQVNGGYPGVCSYGKRDAEIDARQFGSCTTSDDCRQGFICASGVCSYGK